MRKHLRLAAAAISIIILLSAAGCTNERPHFVDGATPPAAVTDAPTEAPDFTPLPSGYTPPEPTAVPSPGANTDALGNLIYSADHYERYISFRNILVYEEDGETLIDCTAVNSYPEVLLFAVNIVFYNDDGEEIAYGSLQSPNGSFLIALPEGETGLYARILTDVVLTDKHFKLTFDPQTGVHPE